MSSRRRFLKIGLGVYAAGACGSAHAIRPVASQGRPARWYKARWYKAIFDERFENTRAFAAEAEARGISTAAIRGDITSLFFDDLDLRWKQGPVLLTGYTTQASLFCLDLLARDRGMRLSHCAAKPSVDDALRVLDSGPSNGRSTALPLGDSSTLVFWTIAPGGTSHT
jgi:hypothetical protein